jgi:hypothetical protein
VADEKKKMPMHEGFRPQIGLLSAVLGRVFAAVGEMHVPQEFCDKLPA